MIPDNCIVIVSDSFPVLEGEREELVNEGMYGKALCRYLESNLPNVGIEVPFFCCEDWGWWIEVKRGDFGMGLCIHSDPDAGEHPRRYAIMSSITKAGKWSWKKFGKQDVSGEVLAILDAVEKVFREDAEIESVSRHDDFPF